MNGLESQITITVFRQDVGLDLVVEKETSKTQKTSSTSTTSFWRRVCDLVATQVFSSSTIYLIGQADEEEDIRLWSFTLDALGWCMKMSS